MKKFEDLTKEELHILNENGIFESLYPEHAHIINNTYHTKKEKLLSFIPDCLSGLFYYDRKECEEVSREDVDYLLKNELITKKEVVEAFIKAIDTCFN